MDTLTGGTHITAIVTGTNRGERFFTRRPFVVSRDQTIERDFIPAREGVPAEDRIFVQRAYGSAPELVVSGSIEVVDAEVEEVAAETAEFAREFSRTVTTEHPAIQAAMRRKANR